MNYTTTNTYADGFGAQYQRIIAHYICSKFYKLVFHYRPFGFIEHNYNNDIFFINKKEELINLKNNIENVDLTLYNYKIHTTQTIFSFFEQNMDELCKSEQMAFIKQCFWANKERDFFMNGKINVAVHIRRLNSHDGGSRNAGERVTTGNKYYLDIINKIRNNYQHKNLLFHIYSQGTPDNFPEFLNQEDMMLHLNDDVDNSFIGMVAADILVTSPSSLSYVAALISDGEIWYKKFWHPPLKHWIIA